MSAGERNCAPRRASAKEVVRCAASVNPMINAAIEDFDAVLPRR
jgi:hypothetical protein